MTVSSCRLLCNDVKVLGLPRSSVCLVAALFWSASGAAQDSTAQEDESLRRQFGGIRIAGEDAPPQSTEAEYSFDGVYGGVSGEVGVTGSRVGGPKKNAPEIHTVQKGDTLWGLSEDYYGNPWAWPQVWSLNPQIENPHWIYPGDQVRTRAQVADRKTQVAEDNSAGPGGFVSRSRVVPKGTIFIRDQGYIGDPERDVWGEIIGAHDETMLLSDGEVVYVGMKEGVDLRLGQRLTVFHEVAKPPQVDEARDPPGEIVKVYGTVRVDSWDRDTRVARTSIIESIDAIERGFQVGPVGRRFDVVQPEPAEVNMEARIITSLFPHLIFGQNQLVFIDKGSEDGLESGNRLRIVRRGDTWRQTLTTSNHHARVRVEMGSPDLPEAETTPMHGDQQKFPDEVIGELTVLRTEDYSAICLVTESSRSLMRGDRAVAVKGY